MINNEIYLDEISNMTDNEFKELYNIILKEINRRKKLIYNKKYKEYLNKVIK